MYKRQIGIILAGGNNRKMRELSQKRAIGAMPVAGSYRSCLLYTSTAACRARCTLFLIGAVESGDVCDVVDA